MADLLVSYMTCLVRLLSPSAMHAMTILEMAPVRQASRLICDVKLQVATRVCRSAWQEQSSMPKAVQGAQERLQSQEGC